MCGIAGVKSFGHLPIKGSVLTSLLLGIEHRGNDATGIAIMDSSLPVEERIAIFKAPIPASAFVVKDDYKQFLSRYLTAGVDTVLLHTRAATVGSPRNNENNHPLWAGGSAVIHNGCLMNETFLFSEAKLTRNAEVDSDIIRAIIDKIGFEKKIFKQLSRISGSAAIAAVHKDFPGQLLLGRSGSPLELGATRRSDGSGLLYWASERNAIQRAVRPWKNMFGVWMQPTAAPALSYSGIPDDTGYLFGPEEMLFHDKFDTCFQYTRPHYDIHGRWKAKQEKFSGASLDRETPKSIVEQLAGKPLVEGSEFTCPQPGCGQNLIMTSALVGLSLEEIICCKCKKALA